MRSSLTAHSLRRSAACISRQKLGFDATYEDVIMTNGSQECFDLLARLFLDPGDRMAVENPGYLGAIQSFSAYAPEKSYTPIIANVSIDYHKPATSDLVVDMTISEEEAAEKIAKIDERGKGRYPLDVPICDKEGNLCATAHITYYLYAKKD